MNPLAKELNELIAQHNPHVLDMLSDLGKNMFFPKGILTQSAEAKDKAKNFIDTVVQRGSDMTASWAHGALQAKGMLLAGFGGLSAVIMIAIVAIGVALGRAYAGRERTVSAVEAQAPG